MVSESIRQHINWVLFTMARMEGEAPQGIQMYMDRGPKARAKGKGKGEKGRGKGGKGRGKTQQTGGVMAEAGVFWGFSGCGVVLWESVERSKKKGTHQKKNNKKTTCQGRVPLWGTSPVRKVQVSHVRRCKV